MLARYNRQRLRPRGPVASTARRLDQRLRPGVAVPPTKREAEVIANESRLRVAGRFGLRVAIRVTHALIVALFVPPRLVRTVAPGERSEENWQFGRRPTDGAVSPARLRGGVRW